MLLPLRIFWLFSVKLTAKAEIVCPFWEDGCYWISSQVSRSHDNGQYSSRACHRHLFVFIQQTWGEKVLGGGIASLIIPICVMISTSGSSNSGIFAGPRYRMSHAGSCIAGFEIKMFILRWCVSKGVFKFFQVYIFLKWYLERFPIRNFYQNKYIDPATLERIQAHLQLYI